MCHFFILGGKCSNFLPTGQWDFLMFWGFLYVWDTDLYQIHDLQIFSLKEMVDLSVLASNAVIWFDKSVISLPASVVSYVLPVCFLVSHLCVYLGNWQIYWRKIACISDETFLLGCPFPGTCPPSTFSVSSSTSSSWSSWPSRMLVPGCCVALLLSTLGNQIPFCLQSEYTAHVKMCSHLSHKRHEWHIFWSVLRVVYSPGWHWTPRVDWSFCLSLPKYSGL